MSSNGEPGRGERPLRFGIMCRGPVFAAWEARCIEHLLAVDGVEAALLIIDDLPAEPTSRGDRLRALFDPRTLLWRLYQRMVLNRRSRSTVPVNLSARLAGVPMIRCRPNRFGKWVQRFQPEEVEAIRSHDLDFIMRFGFNILRGEVLASARHGVWSFHHDDPESYRGQPPGFWEIYNRDPVTGTVLQRLTERLDAGVMLHRGWFRTLPESYPQSRDSIFFGAADWPARLCRQLQSGDAAVLDGAPLSSSAPIYRAPNSWHMLRFIGIWLAAAIGNKIDAVFRVQQWSIGVIDAPAAAVANVSASGAGEALVRSTRWASEPPGRFLADPFAATNANGGLTVLAEDFDWASGRGHIAALRAEAGGAFSAPEPAITLPCHMSYPYLLEVNGALHCVPETFEADGATLFRASPDHRAWTAVGKLVQDVPVVDPTLFQHDGRWWLFATREDEGANVKLFAWHAEAPDGPWTPHLANPIKTDVRSSRPAGPPFVHAGALYRPAQDCSTVYGAAVVINRVLTLTPERFHEEPISRVAPDPAGPYPLGLHTLSGAGERTVIDGCRRAFVPAAAAAVIRNKFGRLVGRRPSYRVASTSSKNPA